MERTLAWGYFGNCQAHPTNHRSRASFGRMASKPDVKEAASLLPADPEWGLAGGPLDDGRLLGSWVAAMRLGFNIGLQGFGSKRALLDRFADELCGQEVPVVVVRGYRRDASVNGLLEGVGQALGYPAPCRSPTAYIDELRQRFIGPVAVVLVIHQIDAPVLRTEAAQEALCQLALLPALRIIASCDNVHAPLLWSPRVQAALSFLWQDCSSFRRYGEEVLSLFEGGPRSVKGGQATVQTFKAVIRVLPPSAHKIYRILAEHQLAALLSAAEAVEAHHVVGAHRVENDDDDDDMDDMNGDDDDGGTDCEAMARRGLSYHDWYIRCQQQILVNSELAFRTQLAEFTDHHLVVGVESAISSGLTYYLPFSRKELREALHFLEAL